MKVGRLAKAGQERPSGDAQPTFFSCTTPTNPIPEATTFNVVVDVNVDVVVDIDADAVVGVILDAVAVLPVRTSDAFVYVDVYDYDYVGMRGETQGNP